MSTYTISMRDSSQDSVEKMGKGEIQLAARQVVRIEHHRGDLELQATSGTLWVTMPGDPDDHLLQAGERLSVSRKGKVVVQGMEKASFRVQ